MTKCCKQCLGYSLVGSGCNNPSCICHQAPTDWEKREAFYKEAEYLKSDNPQEHLGDAHQKQAIAEGWEVEFDDKFVNVHDHSYLDTSNANEVKDFIRSLLTSAYQLGIKDAYEAEAGVEKVESKAIVASIIQELEGLKKIKINSLSERVEVDCDHNQALSDAIATIKKRDLKELKK